MNFSVNATTRSRQWRWRSERSKSMGRSSLVVFFEPDKVLYTAGQAIPSRFAGCGRCETAQDLEACTGRVRRFPEDDEFNSAHSRESGNPVKKNWRVRRI